MVTAPIYLELQEFNARKQMKYLEKHLAESKYSVGVIF